MWVLKIFADEFGFSDVQSNYSRVYSWMANQLGHMTLGMATAFFFLWIVETTQTFALKIFEAGSWFAAFADTREESLMACANFVLLSFAVLFIHGAVVFIAARGVSTRLDADEVDAGGRYRALTPNRSAALQMIVLLAGALILAHLWAHALNAFGTNAQDGYLLRLSAALACIAVAVGAANIVQDLRFVWIGALSLFYAYWIATDGAGFTGDARDSIAVAIPVLFVFLAFADVVLRAKPAERYLPREKFMQFLVNAFIGGIFLFFDTQVKTQEWRLAIGAAIASLTLWWVKEFASDLPNVHREIQTIANRRPPETTGDPNGRDPGLPHEVERDYFADARLDARTDGLFYMAGAWIGAGVLSPLPVLPGVNWLSGAEIVGFLIFLAIFLYFGKNWAYRQRALDKTGDGHASRLAVIHSSLRMKIIDRAAGADKPETICDNPMLCLRDFSGDVDDKGRTEALFRHLIIVGARGSGRSPLGRALASEAALASWPTRFDERGRKPLGPDAERTARFITAHRLLDYLRDIKEVSDLDATPTVPVYYKKSGPASPIEQEIEADGTEAKVKKTEGASLVVIDNASLDLIDPQTGRLDDLFGRLTVRDGQETVWIIHIDDDGSEPWEAVLNQSIADADGLISRLIAESPADACCKIGVALARRSDPPATVKRSLGFRAARRLQALP